jgi:hypothetical protein
METAFTSILFLITDADQNRQLVQGKRMLVVTASSRFIYGGLFHIVLSELTVSEIRDS